ncbi:YceI family protein [Streptacidiphilus sp. PB12-B1b]|uniref:YceI family protein n=1 Tax=Streptacidiphilus sp. PB12-B1b TaxID=2705012 RepID=UPI0015F83067|nr:YceI family protein [Streptacidiphilus sp. PB12-B1b]QMU76185.1 YceI family protein [Streptacidiphilus sp. PB12-B1b]
MTTAITPDLSGSYTIDPAHSTIGFVARHAMVTKVRGSFKDVSGTVTVDAQDPAKSSAQVTIQVASIDTRNPDRDGHLRTNDFLDAATYPTITFASTAAELRGENSVTLTGDLTIKGVTKSIAIDFDYQGAATDPFGNHRLGFEGTHTISRADYGITWNAPLETGGVLVGDKIVLEFDLSLVKSA